MRSPFSFKVGLALGGGAARGLAHVGVLRALERAEIPLDVIVGTSMGSIVGGAYAATRDIAQVESTVRAVVTSEKFRKNRLSFLRETKRRRGGMLFSVSNLVRRGIFYGVSTLRPSFLSAEEFADSMETVVPDVAIESIETPFGAVTLDIETGEEVVLRTGSLRDATRASSAIPGILPPVRLDGRTLIDGGWVDKVPVVPAFRLGADVVIAVDISPELEEVRGFRRGIDIMTRANLIRDSILVGLLSRLADLVIEPDVKRVHWADFGALEQCIESGEEAATRAVPALRDLLRRERLATLVRRRPGKRLADAYLRNGHLRLRFV